MLLDVSGRPGNRWRDERRGSRAAPSLSAIPAHHRLTRPATGRPPRAGPHSRRSSSP
ncbi:hypothetical protein EBESD8_23700 [Rhodococcus aetherivorans]|nr:hypothetical protein EBESD8_23700 [Rhodococcus aetherivorans]